jgi:hypothetical protein
VGFTDRLGDDRAMFMVWSTDGGNGSLGHRRRPSPKAGMVCPKAARQREHTAEQVSRVEISFNERIRFEALESDRQEVARADVLAQHDSQILDRKKTKRHLPQTVALAYEVRCESGLRPPLAFQFLYRAARLHLARKYRSDVRLNPSRS